MSNAASSSGRGDGGARNVAALAGRRIDAVDANEPRFPTQAAPRVKQDIARHLAQQHVAVVVASAACGADILGLEAALELGLLIRIVLPFERVRFRETSVIDRGGAWGDRYDRVLAAAEHIITLESPLENDDAAYGRATARIIEETTTLAHRLGGRAVAIAVWDERPRASGDATQDFVERAGRAGMVPVSVSTLGASSAA